MLITRYARVSNNRVVSTHVTEVREAAIFTTSSDPLRKVVTEEISITYLQQRNLGSFKRIKSALTWINFVRR